MASKRELLKAAIAEVKGGKPRQAVFEAHRHGVNNDKQLAYVIATVADPERIKQGDRYNKILFGLLVFAAVTKGLSALFGGGGLLFLLVGLVVPALFALAVYQYEGQAYPFLVLIGGLGIARALLNVGKEGGWVLIDIALLGAIIWLALQVQRTVFPGLHWFSVRKDTQGNYLW